MINNVGGFLTATALLAAILLVWAQLWHNTWKIYKDRLDKCKSSVDERREIDEIVSAKLAWNYLAILLALVAFGMTVWQGFVSGLEQIHPVAIGFLGASVVMTGIQVIQSFVSAFCKFVKHEPFDKPTSTLRSVKRCVKRLKDCFRKRRKK